MKSKTEIVILKNTLRHSLASAETLQVIEITEYGSLYMCKDGTKKF